MAYHIHIWEMSLQLSCVDICQMWMWFEESNMYFCKIENFLNEEINDQRFINPHPRSQWGRPPGLLWSSHVCWIGIVNSLRPSDAYMHPQTTSSLVQIMACHLFGAKPLSELMMVYCQLDPKEPISMKFYLKIKSFQSTKYMWKCCLQNGSHFMLASMC